MRNTREGAFVPEEGDNVTMQQLVETIRTLQQTVAATRADHAQVELDASRTSNKELHKGNEELRRDV